MKKTLLKLILIAFSAVMILPSCKNKDDDNPKPTTSNPVFSIQPGTYSEAISVGLSCETAGASIYYTTDGSVPSSASTKFTSNIPVTTSTTIKALACKNDYENSSVVEAHYQIIYNKVETPTFSISGGTYDEPIKNLAISCATEDAKIHYTTNGDEPSESSPIYSAPISFSETTTVKAIAYKDGFEHSDIADAHYEITHNKVMAPEFIYPSGTYVGSQTVAIRCLTENAKIFYTTDGSTPTDHSTPYTISFKVTESTTIKAIAYKEGLTTSDIAEAHYEITHEKVQTPSFSISGGTFNEIIKNITISCATEEATIRFTLNGNEPTESSPIYSEPITITETTTIKAKAFKENYTPSDTKTETYIIEVSCDGTITITNANGTSQHTISSVTKKNRNTLIIKTQEDYEMTLVFKTFEPGTFTFQNAIDDPDADCNGSLQYSNIILRFINAGFITVEKSNGIYTIYFTDVDATNLNSLVPVIETVSLSFTGSIL